MQQPPGAPQGRAWFAGVDAAGAVECVDLLQDDAPLRRGGFWAVVGDFEGPVRAWRFEHVRRRPDTPDPGAVDPHREPERTWHGPASSSWTSSLGPDAYRRRVEDVREAIRQGDVYQVNLCRVLSAPLPATDGGEPDAQALSSVLDRGNPAPYAGGVHVPARSGFDPVWVVSASPELFLRVADGHVSSGPIKGTAVTEAGLTDKDRAENIMIADMVRNDLQRVGVPGTVEVTDLLAVEAHPGLVHLVTTVRARMLPGTGWSELLAATYPPASVSGAPKSSALDHIRRVEPVPRGPYCGTIGWIDADRGTAELAVGIRGFWWRPDDGGRLAFGTGAGITWGSDPEQEWRETELKAHRLIGLASAP
ncbi:chloride transporter [Actinotalea ferrariae CF5-4]|uniref:Chloride transporter n=1 Tax=Actinotalea ferrariae CF5-4 TaxID=948458 RepID=A0A021VWS6_9CELL|nr:chorismate-binding protein [Actinotalea ferrariae]EYR64465.1 chloride transporter [Actinotalea ferrariae CF5-4]